MYWVIYGVFLKELRGLIQQPGQWCYPLSFFVWVVALFPLAIGSDPVILKEVAVGAIWIAALLASYLGYHRLFSQDFTSGMLQQSFMSDVPILFQVYGRLITHWLLNGVPIVLMSPMLSVWMGLELSRVAWLMLSLLLGTASIYLINGLMAVLTLQANAASALILLLAMPLQVPIVILGTGVMDAVIIGSAGAGAAWGGVALLASLTFFLITILPWMISAVLKLMVSA